MPEDMSWSRFGPNFESGSGQNSEEDRPVIRFLLADVGVCVVDDLIGIVIEKHGQDASGTHEILQRNISGFQF